MKHYEILATIVAIGCFMIIFLVGILSSVLREENRSTKPYAPYSFSRVQLWFWTLIIIPLFSLNWGYVNSDHPFINETSLVLLSISGTVTLTGTIITAVHVNSLGATSPNIKIGRNSVNFFYDILTDDTNQFSVGRLQNFVFTLVFAVIYITYFFDHGKEYIDFKPIAYVLMGISSGTYLFAKGLYK